MARLAKQIGTVIERIVDFLARSQGIDFLKARGDARRAPGPCVGAQDSSHNLAEIAAASAMAIILAPCRCSLHDGHARHGMNPGTWGLEGHVLVTGDSN